MTPSLLILGGTGFIGRSLCEQWLRQAGGAARITVPTRRLAHAQAVQSLPGVTVVQTDVHDPATLPALVAGHDVVINLIAILQGNENQFQRAHVRLPQTIAAACRASGVRRLVHVSALGVGPNGPSRYLRSKAQGEAILKDAGLDLTLLRPSVVFGAGDHFLNLFARMQALLPVVPLAGAQARFQPVWVEDVAAALVCCAKDRSTVGQTYEIAGPQVLTLAELVRLAGTASGHPRPILPLPGALAWLQARLMELAPGEPLMSRDNLASMQVPNVASGHLPDLLALGIHAHSLASVVPGYLSSGQGVARLNQWRAGARR